MGGRPKAPDNSEQIAASRAQRAELERQQAEMKAQQEATALANTEEARAKRRQSRGRASLITTSEKGFVESNQLTT